MNTAAFTVTLMLLGAEVSGQEQDKSIELIHRIRVDPLGTLGAVDGCEFSKDGKLVSASDNHGVCRVYRVSDGVEVGKVVHHLIDNKAHARGGELNAVPFSKDGRYLCTGRNDDGTKLWRTSDWGLERHLIKKGETDGISFSRDGRWLAAAQDATLRVFNVPGFSPVASIPARKGAINSISFSPDNSLVAFATSAGVVRIARTLDWKVFRELKNRRNKSVKSVRFSADGKLLAYSGGAQSCFVRRVSDWAVVADLIHKGNMKALPGDDHDRDVKVEAVAWSADGGYLFSSGVVDGVMRVWKRSDWTLFAQVQAQEKKRAIEFIDVSADNKVVVGGDEGFIYIYEFRPPPR